MSALASSQPIAEPAQALKTKEGELTPPTSVEEARGTGANAPRITTHPYIGVVAGLPRPDDADNLWPAHQRVGLPDLRGAIGAGFDEASWIPTVFNMRAGMFIGIFSVFLAVGYGIRRVLLVSGAMFTLITLLLPFSSSTSA